MDPLALKAEFQGRASMWQHLNDHDLMNRATRRARRGDPIPADMAAEIERRGFLIPTE